MSKTATETPGITYQASLPLSWRSEPAPSPAALAGWRHSNVTLLRALATLEATVSERDHDPDSHLAKAVERLETKLDIALNMLAQFALQHIDIPAPLPVTLGARSIEWLSDAALPPCGVSVVISLHLSPRLPEPLLLFAQVIVSSEGRCVAEILDEDAEFGEWMARTLFRYHRRGLQARHQG